MNTTNIVIGIGIVGILYYKMKMAPAQPEGFTGKSLPLAANV